MHLLYTLAPKGIKKRWSIANCAALEDYRSIALKHFLCMAFCIYKTYIYSFLEKSCPKKKCTSTILKGNMGYDQYPVPDNVAVEFLLHMLLSFCIRKYTYMASLAILSNLSEEHRTVNSTPPTIPYRTVARTFSDNLSRNSCRQKVHMKTFSFFKTARKIPLSEVRTTDHSWGFSNSTDMQRINAFN